MNGNKWRVTVEEAADISGHRANDYWWVVYVSDGSGRRHRITVIMESRRNGPQLSSRHDDDDDDDGICMYVYAHAHVCVCGCVRLLSADKTCVRCAVNSSNLSFRTWTQLARSSPTRRNSSPSSSVFSFLSTFSEPSSGSTSDGQRCADSDS